MRRLISALAALAVAGSLAAGFGAAPASAATGTLSQPSSVAPALAAIRRFTASLDAHQRAALAGPTGSGVRLDDLSAGQRAAAMQLLDSLLSAEGRRVIAEAMAADDALAAADGGAGSGDYRIGYLETGEGAFLQFAGPQLAVNALVGAEGVIVEPELIQS